MKKAIVIPLASGYFNKCEQLAKQYDLDVDLSNLKPNQKIEKSKHKIKICIGSFYVVNDKMTNPKELNELLESFNKKKEKIEEE